MLQELILGLVVSFAFILGPLLGKWTIDEGRNLRKSGFAKALKKYMSQLAAFYGLVRGRAWNFDFEALASLVIFGLILAQTSLTPNKKMALKSAVVFLFVFVLLTFLK